MRNLIPLAIFLVGSIAVFNPAPAEQNATRGAVTVSNCQDDEDGNICNHEDTTP